MDLPILYTDPIFLEHRTGKHPESPERLRFLYERLEKSPLRNQYDRRTSKIATTDQLALVHDRAYIKSVEDFVASGQTHIESDTFVSPRSFEAACRAAGTAIAAVDAVMAADNSPRAVCLMRPPGHHALQSAPMGFCLFNNVAVAARHALKKHELKRVLIVDWDVHHGNGTQDLFYRDENVYFFSIHRHPFYPGTGTKDETGMGPGLGTKFNVPVAFGTTRKAYLAQFQTTLEAAAKQCKPELVLLSAGFDAHAADPIGSLGLETEDFTPLTRLVRQVADEHCKGKLVSLLEGGYNIQKLAESIECHLEGMA